MCLITKPIITYYKIIIKLRIVFQALLRRYKSSLIWYTRSMTKDEFKKKKIEGREEIFKRVIDVFKDYNPYAIHQFGSGKSGYRDEFSDIDLIITFEDDKIKEILDKRDQVLNIIAPVLLKNEAPKNSPVGGKNILAIHELNGSLFHIDYFISRKSKVVIGDDFSSDALHIFGDDDLPRGKWVLDRDALDVSSLSTDINNICIMCFIGIKGVIRKWGEPGFTNFVKGIYSSIEKLSNKKLETLPEKLSFELIYKVFDNVYPLADKKQQVAIDKIRKYAKEVKSIYM